MLEEIGLVISLYVVTRLVPCRWKALYVSLSVATALLTLAVIADLGLRATTGNTLASTLMATGSGGLASPEVGYKIERTQDEPFRFSISGIPFNYGSSLIRESILFNDPTSPVQIDAHSISIKYEANGFIFVGKTGVEVKKPIVAVEIRTILFDVFGQRMKNLANSDTKDFLPGKTNFEGTWLAGDNDLSEFLTTVSYVARVRYADGSQWIFNGGNLVLALASLNLEQEIGEQDQE